jgi:hypothetical protein
MLYVDAIQSIRYVLLQIKDADNRGMTSQLYSHVCVTFMDISFIVIMST